MDIRRTNGLLDTPMEIQQGTALDSPVGDALVRAISGQRISRDDRTRTAALAAPVSERV